MTERCNSKRCAKDASLPPFGSLHYRADAAFRVRKDAPGGLNNSTVILVALVQNKPSTWSRRNKRGCTDLHGEKALLIPVKDIDDDEAGKI